MFNFANIIGIYSYVIFSLGLLQLLYKEIVVVFTLIFFTLFYFIFLDTLNRSWKNFISELYFLSKNKLFLLMLLLFFLLALVNLIGALGPELAFDALWYHLTFPNLYLLHHAVYHIPGGLLYYSDMPKLGELLYVGALAFGNEITAKVLHWSFGILVCFSIYIFSKKLFSRHLALLAVVIFYANLVVSWESTTAYIDLIRTFFEFLALWAFVLWFSEKKTKWLLTSALMTGLAISTKLLALGSLGIFLILLIGLLLKRKMHVTEIFKQVFLYISISLVIPLPWLIFSFYYTSNPVYPFFTSTYGVELSPFNPIQIVTDIWSVLLFSPDPISPVYLLCIPLIVIYFAKFTPAMRLMIVYSFLSLLVWYITPRTGGGRFLLVYLPTFSVVCAGLVNYLFKEKDSYSKKTGGVLIGILLFVAVTSIIYRAVANYRYIPVIIGVKSEQAFLKENLNFAFGDFYDIDGYFKKTITSQDKVLLYGFHNLYYVDFPFVDSSWVKKGDAFNYVAVHGGEVPKRFSSWDRVYENKVTKVKLYTDDKNYYHY